jgi:hypothetical protein
MATPLPTVLEGVDFLGFIQHVLDKHTGPSALIVCSTKDVFMESLQSALEASTPPREGEEITAQQARPTSQKLAWQTPILRLLASSRTVRLVFCPELTHLRAYLSTYAYRPAYDRVAEAGHSTKAGHLLAILNPIDIHRPTSAFSAQGINRTLAVAVEAAYRSESQLLLAECSMGGTNSRPDELSLFGEEHPDASDAENPNPWDEEVSILNVTTKSFGAGERGWVGRTVKLRRIAGRWFRFHYLNATEG